MKLNIDNLGLNRKLNKLKKDPELFVKDMIFKRTAQVKKHIPIKYSGSNQFTIISAIYNVGRYLDDFFESIVKQRLDFKKHIHLICVDDGSVDNSAEIIKKWQKKYPKNIQYIYKENGGQASARNLALEYVNTEWSTFIDPDDYIHPDYFLKIDQELVKNKNLNMVITNIIFYMEAQNKVKDRHSLNYRFNSKERLFDMKDIKNNVSLSASTTIFKHKYIKNNNIVFSEYIKPNFEDGKFISDYMLYCDNGEALFLKEAIYYYRKRADNSSTLDGSWSKPEKFYNVPKYGYLGMLADYKAKYGYVPVHIQRTALYDISWYVDYLINNANKISFLTEEQKKTFLNLVIEIFSYIDEKTILDFNLGGVWFFQKIGMLGMFKQTQPENLIVYVENVDKEKQQILLSYFTYFDLNESFQLNGIDTLPAYEKNTEYDFVNEKFVTERRIWIPFATGDEQLKVILNDVNARVSLNGKQHGRGILVKNIVDAFTPSTKYEVNDSWVLMDRDTQADDNAEHLYRYIKENHPEQQIYFALREESHDWQRLEDDGFNLLNFGSSEFELRLRQCSKIISSHFDDYIANYFGDEYEYSKKFVFLQHGLTKDDMSRWFNSKRNLQCLVTASPFEYQSIVGNNTHYKLTEKEVVLTGFPRHDRLLEQDENTNILLVMPTWRSSIVGATVGQGNVREINDGFMDTLYAQSWYELLHSNRLKDLAEQYNYQIVFAPHANIIPYLEQFDVPSYIKTWRADENTTSIQKLFQNAKMMLTDYSSVAFEMGYLQKAVIYYQFDKQEVFSGDHIYQKGYFDYELDGFGPVEENAENVLNCLEDVFSNEGKPAQKYLERMAATFPFRDGKCCERVYNAILELDQFPEKQLSLHTLQKYIATAEKFEDSTLLESRYTQLLGFDLPEIERKETLEKLGYILLNANKWNELKDLIAHEQIDIPQWNMEISLYEQKWNDVLEILKISKINDWDTITQLFCYVKLEDSNKFQQLFKKISKQSLNEEQVLIMQYLKLVVDQNWLEILETDFSELIAPEILKKYDLNIYKALAYKNTGDVETALQMIKNVESTTLDYRAKFENIKMLHEKNEFSAALKIFNSFSSEDFDSMNLDEMELYSFCLFKNKQWKIIVETHEEWLKSYENDNMTCHYLWSLREMKLWEQLVDFYESYTLTVTHENLYPILLAHYRLGMFEKCYEYLIQPTYEYSYQYWLLALEIYAQFNNLDMFGKCKRGLFAVYPHKHEYSKERIKELEIYFFD